MILAQATPASATDLEWLNTGGGTYFFDVAGNWSPAQTPSATDDLLFSADVGADPIVVGPASAANGVRVTDYDWVFTGAAGGALTTGGLVDVSDSTATFLDDAVALNLTDNLTWDSANNVAVGRSGYGRLTLDGGTQLTGNRIYVGDGAGSVGEITLTGPGTTLAASLLNVNSGLHLIGYRGGTGVMNVMAGAQLRTLSNNASDITIGGFVDSVGTLNIDGVGSFTETEDLIVGQLGGTGYLNITNGGQSINTDGGSPDTYFGLDVGSSGTGVVDGNGSLLSSRSVFLGYDGMGRLEVRGGGEMRTAVDSTSPSDMHIGMVAGSDGRGAVYGTAPFGIKSSLLDVHGSLYVGTSGTGELYVGLDLQGNEIGSGAVRIGRDLNIGEDFGNNNDNRVIISGSQATVEVVTPS